jgi:hypothetical protein
MLINRRVVPRPGIHGRLQIFPTFISVQVLSVFLAGWLGLSLVAAVEGVSSSAQQTCFHDTLQLVNNETLQSRRKILWGCPVQRGSECTGDYNSTVKRPMVEEAFVPMCEQENGGIFVRRDHHLYCGPQWTFHELNFPYCVAGSCATMSDGQLDQVIKGAYYPYIWQNASDRGFNCSISRKPRPRGWRWWLLLIAVAVVSVPVLGYMYWRRTRVPKDTKASNEAGIVERTLVAESGDDLLTC